MIQKKINGQLYEYFSFSRLEDDILALAKQILDSKQKFDRLVALAKGGLAFSRSMVDYLDIKKISTFQIEFYQDVNTTNKTPIITQSLATDVLGENILLFDDVIDTGETLKLAQEYLNHCGAKSITTSSLVAKQWTPIAPDFVVHTSKAWVIFPNEVRETISLLSNNWKKTGNSPQQIHRQLLEIGFSRTQVDLFYKPE